MTQRKEGNNFFRHSGREGYFQGMVAFFSRCHPDSNPRGASLLEFIS
jgi:hypothetical protein